MLCLFSLNNLLALLLTCSVIFSVALSGKERTPVKECYGTDNGIRNSDNTRYRYQRMKWTYTGCTHVLGNLEIVHLNDKSINFDLSFLKDIRYVSGYVLVGVAICVKTIPLLSLEIIRGNSTFWLGGNYGLAVAFNSQLDNSGGLVELQMPSLQEISNGNVLFMKNPTLGYVDTIDWDVITRHRPDSVEFRDVAYNKTASSTVDRSKCPLEGMWGKNMCQARVPDEYKCHDTCNGRCFGTGSDQCCHDTCAVGCVGETDTDCLLCKDFEFDSQCVAFCPSSTFHEGQTCMKD